MVIAPQLYVDGQPFLTVMKEAGVQAEWGPLLLRRQYAAEMAQDGRRRNRVLVVCHCGDLSCGATVCRSEVGDWNGEPGEMLYDFAEHELREHVVPFAVFLPDSEWSLLMGTFYINEWPTLPITELRR